MQAMASQIFPEGTGGMTALPAGGAMGRMLSSGLGSGVSSPPSTAPGASIRRTPEINPASLQPGTNGALGLLSRSDNDADDASGSQLLGALRRLFDSGSGGMAPAQGLTGGIGEMPQGVAGFRAPIAPRPGVMALTGQL